MNISRQIQRKLYLGVIAPIVKSQDLTNNQALDLLSKLITKYHNMTNKERTLFMKGIQNNININVKAEAYNATRRLRAGFALLSAFVIATLIMVSINAASLSGGIDSDSISDLKDQIAEEVADSKEITIYLNSPGGYLKAGFDLINHIRAYQAKGIVFVGIVEYQCASMCFTILQTMDKRYMYPMSMIMQHNVSPINPYSLSLERIMSELEAKRMGMNTIDWIQMTASRYGISMRPSMALRLNAIDEVVYPENKEPTLPEMYQALLDKWNKYKESLRR